MFWTVKINVQVGRGEIVVELAGEKVGEKYWSDIVDREN